MKKINRKLIVVLVIVSIIGIAMGLNLHLDKSPNPKSTASVTINNARVFVEVAQTPAEKQKGLMFREYMAEDEGMLFILDSTGIYSFWMKNTLIPLDLIWFDENWRIVDIKQNVPPCTVPTDQRCPSYTPKLPVRYTLEVNGGWVEKNNVSIGDYAQYQPQVY